MKLENNFTNQDLQIAARRGDIEFLRKCVASNKPTEFYLAPNNEEDDKNNLFHLSVLENREEFIREAINILPLQTLQSLILQQCREKMYNPLHRAAMIGNVEIVKLFLNVFRRSTPLPLDARPWLGKSRYGETPCHLALYFGQEDCGLELLRMDMELLCAMVDDRDYSLMGRAVWKGLNKVAFEILSSPFSFSCLCSNHTTALHHVTTCTEGEEICRRLLERKPELMTQTSKSGVSILCRWAAQQKIWPYECLLKSNDIIPNVRKVFVDLISVTEHDYGCNPLHILALKDISSEKEDIEIAKLLIDTYKQEAPLSSSSISRGEVVFPWLMQDKKGRTPLDMAIECGKEQFAMYMISVEDENAFIESCSPQLLLFAIEKRCSQVAQYILDIVDEKGFTHFLTNEHKLNAMHIAPKCKKEFFQQLIKRHPELLERVDKYGDTIFHIWVKIGEVWPFEYVLNGDEIDRKWRSHLVKYISAFDYKIGDTPLHVAAYVSTTNDEKEATYNIAKILVEAYKEENPYWRNKSPVVLPWFQANRFADGALHLAILNQHEKLALYILSQLEDNSINELSINELLDYYKPEHKTLFLAIENNCIQVAKQILSKLDKGRSWTKYLVDCFDGRTVLHLAPYCKDKEFGIWLVNEAFELITLADNSENTALDEASNVGAASIVQAILEKDPSALTTSPLAWVQSCKKGHTLAISAFFDNYPEKFRNHCITHKDSPLHHIQLSNHREYEEFLKIQGMMELVNVQDSEGETPLHKAIQREDIILVEKLLLKDKMMYNIKNKKNKTAIDLLEQKCIDNYEWDQMCKSIGFDARMRTTFFQRKSNLSDVRNSLSVVAALLATITFTAGFTLPGGLDQNTGEAMLANKATFLVFLLSDTLAMCFSLLVLACLIWSMVYDNSSVSLELIDKSMVLLIPSLYFTLVAFMTGVYVVLSPKSLWAAIVIVVMCSIMGILAHNTLLRKVLFIGHSKNKEHKQGCLIRLLKLFKRKDAGSNNLDLEKQN